MFPRRQILTAAVLLIAAVLPASAGPVEVLDFPVPYPGTGEAPEGQGCPHKTGSTHEITFDEKSGGDLWITGQNYDQLVQVGMDRGVRLHAMPKGSGPHGIEFDAAGQLWVTLEFQGKVVRLGKDGKIAEELDVDLHAAGAAAKIPTNPHGLGIGPDGKTVWFTGKATGTIGRIQDGKVAHFPLATVGAVPIYIKAGPGGYMWVTELVGNKIARVSPQGEIAEFAIPTANSRPIAITPEPGGKNMWFSEEAGNKVARIDPQGKITEFPVPKMQDNVILAGLAFDGEGNLWTQQYVDTARPFPAGADYLVKIGKTILEADPGEIGGIPITFYKVPTANTVMHRIVRGPDGNLWFTELKADRVGVAVIGGD